MDKELAMKWVAALRSGKYVQGKSYLKSDGKHCCLGVLCEIEGLPQIDGLVITAFSAPDGKSEYEVYPGKSLTTKSGAFKRFIKLKGRSAAFYELTAMNDAGVSFKTIAKLIEKYYKDL